MAQNLIVQLTDDMDGGEAVETLIFALDGKNYEIDLNAKNAEKLRRAFLPFIEKARTNRELAKTGNRRSTSSQTKEPTLFSQLDAEQKDRFRSWAEMPTARRIADARVQEWIDAGRP